MMYGDTLIRMKCPVCTASQAVTNAAAVTSSDFINMLHIPENLILVPFSVFEGIFLLDFYQHESGPVR